MARRVTRRLVLLTASTLLAGCAGLGEGETPTGTDNPAFGQVSQMTDLDLTSTAFDDGESIPEKYGKAFENVNPPLSIEGVPDAAESLALVVDDPDAPGGTFTHWLVWNVPTDVGTIPEDWTPPTEVSEGTNDFGNVGYDGPKPPSEHTYRFKLFALSTELDLSSSSDQARLGNAMQGTVVGQTHLTGTFAPN